MAFMTLPSNTFLLTLYHFSTTLILVHSPQHSSLYLFLIDPQNAPAAGLCACSSYDCTTTTPGICMACPLSSRTFSSFSSPFIMLYFCNSLFTYLLYAFMFFLPLQLCKSLEELCAHFPKIVPAYHT